LSTCKGDQIFIFSDGYADQFGGPKGKKYNYRRFRNYLLEIADLDMAAQRTSLELEFEKWLGNTEQIDDVLVLSVRI
jgi:serine phosphatase RsbU (regulator of sigma subunit)